MSTSCWNGTDADNDLPEKHKPEDVEYLSQVKIRCIPFNSCREVENVSAILKEAKAAILYFLSAQKTQTC